MAASITPVEDAIRQKISSALQPTVLEIVNESHLHAHHEAMKGVVSKETHFKYLLINREHTRLLVASDEFAGKNQLARHRLVYGLCKEEMDREGGIHALNIVAKTPAEFEKMNA